MLPSVRRYGIALLTATVLVAACAGSDGEVGPAPSSSPNPVTTTTTAGASTTASASTSSVAQPAAPVRGVNARSIRLGVLLLDLDALAGLGISGQAGDVEAVWRALLEQVNRDGGVHGRRLVPVFHRLLPTPELSERACIVLAEDERVFAVMGPLLPEGVLCFTETNEVAFISPWVLTAEQFDRSLAPVQSVGPSAERMLRALARMLDEQGALTSARTAVVGRADNEAQVDTMVEALTERGADVVAESILDVGRFDQLALDAALDVATERWGSVDADLIVVVGGLSTSVAGALERSGLSARLALTSGEGVDAANYLDAGVSLEVLAGAVGVGAAPDEIAYREDPRLRQCIDDVEATEPGVDIDVSATDGALSELRSAMEACQLVELFALAADAAGPELDHDSFGSALASLGPVDLPGLAHGSSAAPKRGVADEFWLFAFDPDAGDFEPVGDPLVDDSP